MSTKTYEGSCHCGAVRYDADLDLEAGTTRCNCSYCTKGRAWFSVAKGPGAFRLQRGAESLSEYRWTPPGRESHLRFAFCRVCGVRVYGRGEVDFLGGVFHAVAVATLDEIPADVPINYIDGKHDRYDVAPELTRLL